MELSSRSFAPNSPIPDKHTVKGEGTSPPLMISKAPPGTGSLALIVHDPDAPGGDFTHWLVWNINPATTIFPEGQLPAGAIQGLNDFGKVGYGPPAPPSGTHRYVFDLYALDAPLELTEGTSLPELRGAMRSRIRAQSQLIGTVDA